MKNLIPPLQRRGEGGSDYAKDKKGDNFSPFLVLIGWREKRAKKIEIARVDELFQPTNGIATISHFDQSFRF